MKQSLVRALFVVTAVVAFASPSFATSILLNSCDVVGLCNQVMVTTTFNAGAINVTVSDVAGAPAFGIFGDSGANHAFGFNVVGSTAGLNVTGITAGFSWTGGGGSDGGVGTFEELIDGPHTGSGASLPLSFTVTRTGGFTSDSQLLEANGDGFFFGAHVRNNDTGLTGYAAASDTPIIDPHIGGDPVPEPGSMILLGTGLLGLAAGVRRRTKK